ncbi:hypothetical protein GCK72_007164 [Caenorhabditis remanei]|uniref:DUF281 domain-containing protein n=1 Tax=Caenorhabditis remanei TaxID=31234 RepID=A0A6A5HID2_CAERE|nr:hypothetical protein GCK72_007164 [Caenorhabditis remanei]KAF1767205.1 hypothetical protein GCK72_007164 [Caenorhabditis remanei]
MNFPGLLFIFLVNSQFFVSIEAAESTTPASENCKSCDPLSLKLVSRNNTPAPIIMGNFHENGCVVTVVACDIPECSDAVLDSYLPDGSFKRVTNDDGTVWPHLELTCSPEGKYMWNEEVQTEFSCYSEDCYIPTTTSPSTVSEYTLTTTVNSIESTAYSESTDYTVSLASTTSDRESPIKMSAFQHFQDAMDTVPISKKQISNEGCGTYFVDCRPEKGQICDNILLYNGLEVVSQSPVCAQLPVSCAGNGFGNEGVGVVSNMFCKFKNCRDNVTSTSEETTPSLSTVSEYSFTTTVNGTESTVSVESTDYTVSLASTTSDRCNGHCTDFENILLNDNVKLTRPVLKQMSNEGCGTYLVDCRPEIGQVCDNIVLYSGFEVVSQSQICAQLVVSCGGNGFGNEGVGAVSNMFCKFKNCRDDVTSEKTTYSESKGITTSN